MDPEFFLKMFGWSPAERIRCGGFVPASICGNTGDAAGGQGDGGDGSQGGDGDGAPPASSSDSGQQPGQTQGGDSGQGQQQSGGLQFSREQQEHIDRLVGNARKEGRRSALLQVQHQQQRQQPAGQQPSQGQQADQQSGQQQGDGQGYAAAAAADVAQARQQQSGNAQQQSGQSGKKGGDMLEQIRQMIDQTIDSKIKPVVEQVSQIADERQTSKLRGSFDALMRAQGVPEDSHADLWELYQIHQPEDPNKWLQARPAALRKGPPTGGRRMEHLGAPRPTGQFDEGGTINVWDLSDEEAKELGPDKIVEHHKKAREARARQAGRPSVPAVLRKKSD